MKKSDLWEIDIWSQYVQTEDPESRLTKKPINLNQICVDIDGPNIKFTILDIVLKSLISFHRECD
ncbi:MAG: hypothetical protein AMJ53_01835 [Gammaproteobacteria bacterium SG8_11]|nr:MAG: hypothetical protein AMJ53_01835 [Gammaproteobacteria bacterium SG8_11]